MALLRNIDHVGNYTSSTFIIDNFVQGELWNMRPRVGSLSHRIVDD